MLGNRFKCEACSTLSAARGYFLFSALYALILVAFLGLCTLLMLEILEPTRMSFEYSAAVATALTLFVIFYLSPYYWKLVIRWEEVNA